MRKTNGNVWNSLEITKLLFSLFTPIIILLIGMLINQNLRNIEEDRSKKSAVIDQRTVLWRELAGPLNDIYAFNLYVGSWQSITPRDLIKIKRDADKVVYSYRPFFSDSFFSAYNSYMNEAFDIERGWKLNAGIRALKDHRSVTTKADEDLIGEDNRDKVHNAYYVLLGIVAEELDLEIDDSPPIPDQLK